MKNETNFPGLSPEARAYAESDREITPETPVEITNAIKGKTIRRGADRSLSITRNLE